MNIDVLENGVKNNNVTFYDFLGKKIQIGDIISYSHTNHVSFVLCVVVSVEKDGYLRVVPLKETPIWLNVDYRYSAKLNPKATPCIVLSSLIQTQNPDIYKEAKEKLDKFYALNKQGRAKKKCIVFMKYDPDTEYARVIPETVKYFNVEDIALEVEKLIDKYKEQDNVYVLDKHNSFIAQEDFFDRPKFLKKLGWIRVSDSWRFDDRIYKLSKTNAKQLLYTSTYELNDDSILDRHRWHEATFYTVKQVQNGLFTFFYHRNNISYIINDNDNIIKLINPNSL